MEVLKALKNLKSYLAIALTVAMVFGSVPSVAFGAEELGNNEPETAETEEIITDGAANGFAEEPTEMPEETGSTEGIDPVNSYQDVNVWISKVSGTKGTTKVASNLDVYAEEVDGAVASQLTTAVDKFVDTQVAVTDYRGEVRSAAAAPDAADNDDTYIQETDSENDYSFYVKAATGYKWPSNASEKIYKVWYGNYDTTLYSAAWDDDGYIPTDTIKGTKIVDVTRNVEVSSVDWDAANSVRKITIKSDTLKDVIRKTRCKDVAETYAKPIIIVQLSDFEDADLATGVISPFTYTNDDGDATNSIKTTARTAKYKTGALGTADSFAITKVQKSVKGNVTLSPEMITVKYTKPDGTSKTYTGSSSAINNTADLATSTGAGVVKYTYSDADNGKLEISQALINAFVSDGGTIDVNINTGVEPAGSSYRLTTEYKSDYAVVKKDSGFAVTMPTTIEAANNDFTFYVKVTDGTKAPKKGTRTIKNVEVTEDDGTELTATAGAAGLYTIGSVQVAAINSNVTINVTTNETLYNKCDSHAKIYNIDGAAIGASTDAAESGEPYKFDVRADAGYKVTKVAYNIGQNQELTSATEITRGRDGFYTTGDVTDALTIHVVTEPVTSTFNVVNISGPLANTSVYNGTVDKNTASPVPLETAKSAASEMAYLDEPYVFTVFTKLGTDIDSVTARYDTQTSTAYTLEPISESYDTTNSNPDLKGTYTVYRTAAKNKDIYITVATSASLYVQAPANRKVSTDFAEEPSETVRSSKTEDFYFKVTPANSNIKIVSVNWVEIDNNGDDVVLPAGHKGDRVLTDKKLADGRYKIPSVSSNAGKKDGLDSIAATSLGIRIDVKTIETVTSGYTAEFKVDGVDPTKPETDPCLVNTYAADGVTITDQELRLILGEKTSDGAALGHDGYLTAVFKDSKGADIGAPIGTFNTELEKDGVPTNSGLLNKTYHATSTLDTKNITKIDPDDDAAVVTGQKKGTDVITAQSIVDDGTWNKLVYRKDLNVKVTDAYENLKVVVTKGWYTSTNNQQIAAIQTVADDETLTVNSIKVATFTLVGTNMRTKKVEELNDGDHGVDIKEWKFNPDNSTANPKTVLMSGGFGGGKFTDGESKIEDAGSINVCAITPQTAKVVASVKLAGETRYTDYSQIVKVVDAKDYLAYPTLTINNGRAVEGTDTITSNYPVPLESDTRAEAMNSASIGLDVYADVRAEEELVDIGTKKKLEEAIDDGYVTKVAPTYDFTVANKVTDPTKPDSTEYVAVKNEGSGKFTVTAKKALPTTVNHVLLTITAKMDDVVVATSTYRFTVTPNVAKKTVYLKLDNAENKGSDDKVVQQVITGSYYTGRENSIVEDSANYQLPDPADRGIMFTKESVGGTFILPTQADFDAAKAGSDYVLVAWQHNGSGDYYRPGGKWTVNGTSDNFKAIWARKYDWPAGEKRTYGAPAAEKGNGLALYSGHAAVVDEKGETTYGAAFSMADDSSSTIGEATLGTIGNGGNIPVVLRVSEYRALSVKETTETKEFANYGTEAALLTAVAKDTYPTSGITLTSEDANYSEIVQFNGSTIKAIGTGKTNVRAAWGSLKTVPINVEVVTPPEYTLTLDDDTVQVEEVNADKSPKQMVATLKDGTKTITGSDINGFKWTWTSDNKEVADIVGDDTDDNGNKGNIIAKKAGKANISVVATDASGIEATLAKAAVLTVTDSGVTVNVVEDETVVSKVEAELSTASLLDAMDTGYDVAVAGGKTGVTFNTYETDVTGDGVIVAEQGSAVGSGDEILIQTALDEDKGYEPYLSDKGEFYVFYKYGGTQYKKIVPVTTYYSITLDAGDDNVITKDGSEYKVDDKNVQTVDIKIPVSSQTETVKEEADGTKKYSYTYTNISLDGYAADWKKDNNKMSFRAWVDSVPVTYTASIPGPLRKGSIGRTGTSIIAGDYTLDAKYGLPDITKVTTANDTITLVNDETPDKGAVNWASVKFDVEPYDTTQHMMMVPDKVGFFKHGYFDAVGTLHTWTLNGNLAIDDNYIDTTTIKDVRTDTVVFKAIDGMARRAGKAVLTFKTTDDDLKVNEGSKDLATLTLYVNGYDSEEKAFYENGVTVKDDYRAVSNMGNYYFDVSGNYVDGSKLVTRANGSKILILNGKVADPGLRELVDETGKKFEYFVIEGGSVAMASLVQVDGVQRYANSDGVLVTYEMSTNGKYTDPKTNVTYKITQGTNAAEVDAILYAPSVKFHWPETYTKGTNINVKYDVTVSVKDSNGKESKQEIKDQTASVTPSTVSAGNLEKKIEFTATADLSMYYKEADITKGKAENKTDKKTYNFKNGSVSGNTGGDVSEDGEAESEPEKSEVAGYNSYNLFYTDAVIPVEGLASDATLGGKAGGFFVNNGDGTVSVKKGASASEIKKAAKPANSLIELTDSEGAVFSYQLPVYYQKPSLKLTSTKATVNKSAYDKTTIHTTVTQKKSNGLYEPVEVDAESDPAEVTFAPGKNKANLTIANGDNSGELAITATAKTSGKIVVKKANWAEDVKLSYTVAESSKDVIEGSTKNVILNSTGKSDGEQEVTLTLNGGEDMTGVTATFPKANKWAQAGVEIENVDTSDGNKLTSNELKVKFTEGASHKKGSYTVTFKAPDGKGKFALKITVSNKALSDGVKLTVKSKMDITTGQKMVVVPQLTQVGGPIENVTIETVGNFGCDYNATTNQIIVTTSNPNLTAGKYTQSFHVTTAVEEFDVELKNFQVTAKKPAVKVPTITFPKTSLGTAELAGSTNVCATYKQNGKTFSTAPIAVSFPNGTPSNNEKFTADEGWFLDSKTNALVKYDAETGKILVQTVSGSKKGTVKVNFLFKGMDSSKPMKKSFKIAAK